MKYTYTCPQCKETEEKEMSVADYAEYEAICPRCKVKMERVYEVPVVKGGSDGEGVTENDSVDSSSGCTGSCSSCTSCGF